MLRIVKDRQQDIDLSQSISQADPAAELQVCVVRVAPFGERRVKRDGGLVNSEFVKPNEASVSLRS